jgi:hypothetical protein
MLGSLPTTTPRPTRRGWSQVVPAQPALDGPRRGEFVPPIHSRQFDTDASSAPAGMLTAQLEGGFQRRWSDSWARSTGVIAGLQSRGSLVSPGLQGSTYQAPDRAQGQVEMLSDFRGSCPEPGHTSEGQPQRKISRAWHWSRLPVRQVNRPGQTVPAQPTARNLVSQFRAKHCVA